jgi:DNA-binding transcriptional ArsR family regulator
MSKARLPQQASIQPGLLPMEARMLSRPPPRRLLVVSRDEPELRRVVLQETRALLLEQLKRPRADGKPGWTVHELSQRFGFTSQNIHHHLKILEAHGLARVAGEEATNGLARQFWTTDVEHVYTDMAPDAKAALARAKAMAHHAAPPDAGDEAGYFRRHFDAMARLGAAVPPERQAEVVAFYRRESALFSAAFEALQAPLQQAAQEQGVAEAKSALHFAALARMPEEDFDAWVQGLRALRAAVRAADAAPREPVHQMPLRAQTGFGGPS